MKKVILISFFTASCLLAAVNQQKSNAISKPNEIATASIKPQGQTSQEVSGQGQGRIINAPSITQRIERSPELPQKLSQKSFDSVVEMLKTKESTKAQREYEDKKEKEAREKAELEEEKKLKKAELNEMLLPIPLRSITFGDKITVYAEYREKKLSDNAKIQEIKVKTQTDNSNNLPNQQDEDKLDAVYDKKTVELKVGDVFGDWRVKTLTITYVEYENKRNDNKIIKKYY